MSSRSRVVRFWLAATSCGAIAAAQQFVREAVPASTMESGPIIPIDLDGDGDDDLLAQDALARSLHVFLRIGPGRFVAAADAPVALGQLSRHGQATVGDVDRDGDLDLVGIHVGGVLALVRNRGGLLTRELQSATVGNPPAIQLFDADGDGDLDLLVAGGATQLLSNDGTGTFTPAAGNPLPNGNPVVRVATGDLDGDGRPDLIVGDGDVRCWMVRGSGLVDESAQRLPTLPGTVLASGAADVDGDGDLDLFGSRSGPATNAWLLRNDGTGRFLDVSTTLPTMPPGVAGSAVAADDDGDGDADLLLGTTLLRNTGAGAFQRASRVLRAPEQRIDLDGDPFADYITAEGIVRNRSGLEHILWTRTAGFAAADVDRDGDQDVLGTRAMWRCEGGVRIAEPAGFALVSATGDLDGDGDQDFVELSNNTVLLRENDGTGTFTSRPPLSVSASVRSALLLFDYDQDGDPDILHTRGLLTTERPGVLRNDGNWTFTAAASPFAAGSIGGVALAIGDVDADGLIDVVAGSPGAAQILRNRGNGAFDLAATLPFGGEVLEAAQLDRDPELEIVMLLNPTVRIFDRTANGWSEVTATRLPGPPGPATRVIVADLDTDGDQDLVLAGGGGFLLLNDGLGSFTDVTHSRGPFTATAWTTFDADADGDPDVLDGVHLWVNQQRQLTLAAPVRAGGVLALEYVGERGFGRGVSVAIATLALSRSATGTPMFGGRWLPDAAGSIVLAALPSIGGQPAGLTLPVPGGPQFVGLQLHLQGLVIGSRGELALANHIATTIE